MIWSGWMNLYPKIFSNQTLRYYFCLTVIEDSVKKLNHYIHLERLFLLLSPNLEADIPAWRYRFKDTITEISISKIPNWNNHRMIGSVTGNLLLHRQTLYCGFVVNILYLWWLEVHWSSGHFWNVSMFSFLYCGSYLWFILTTQFIARSRLFS